MSLLEKLEFKCQSKGMETCLHSRGAALNVRDTIRAEQKIVCFIAQLMRKSPKMIDPDAS